MQFETIEFVKSSVKQASTFSGVTSDNADFTGCNLIIVATSLAAIGVAHTVSDTIGGVATGNSWTLLEKRAVGTREHCVYQCLNPVTGNNQQFSINGTSTYSGIRVLGFRNIDATTGLVGSNFSTSGTNGTTQQTGPLTPIIDGCLLISSVLATGTGFTVNSGYVEYATDHIGGLSTGGATGYLIQASAAAVNPTWSWTGSSVRGGWSGYYKPKPIPDPMTAVPRSGLYIGVGL